MHAIIEKYCSKEWYEFIGSHCETRNYKADEMIFKIGEKTDGLFFIDEGRVKVSTRTTKGKTRIIRLASSNDILGHRGFGGDWAYSINAQALASTTVTFLPIEIFNQTVKTNPDFGFFMMMFFAEELRTCEHLAKQLPVKNFIASVIYKNYVAFGFDLEAPTKLSFSLSRKDIANMAGVSYESTIRTLLMLNNEEIIKLDKKEIHILDLQSLLDLAQAD